MLRAADAQRLVPAFTIDQLNVRMTTRHTSITTFEPREHVLHRPANRQANLGTLLTRDQGFRQYGQGTWQGAAKSLQAFKLPSDDRASIYAGSSDGMLCRYKMEVHTPPGGTPHEALVVQATSNDGTNQPYNLGALTFGLVVGDFADLGYPVVIAGAYRRLGVFRADTLQLVRNGGVPLTMELPWDLTEPRHLLLADIDGNAPGNEVAFTTLHGRIAVVGRDGWGALALRAQHSEGGVVNLCDGPGAITGTQYQRGLYLLSDRGHMARVEFRPATFGQEMHMGRLTAASALQYGAGRDVVRIDKTGPLQGKAAALFYPHPAGLGAIRIFDMTTSTGTLTNPTLRLAELGNLNLLTDEGDTVAMPPIPASVGDPEPVLALASAATGAVLSHFVVMGGDHLVVLDTNGNCVGYKRVIDALDSCFWPGIGMSALVTGDFDPAVNGDEVVVSTCAGRMLMFRMSELLTGAVDTTLWLTFGSTTTQQPEAFTAAGTGITYTHRMNTMLSATWALQPSAGGVLQAIDQAGAWWTVDAQTGAPIFQRQVAVIGREMVGLAYDGGMVLPGQQQGGGFQHTKWDVIPQSASDALLQTQPYVIKNTATDLWALADGNPAPPVNPAPYLTSIAAKHWVMPFGGGLWFHPSNGTRLAAWWSDREYPNLVQGLKYDSAFNPVTTTHWNTSSFNTTIGQRPTSWISLRAEGYTAVGRAQALAIGALTSDSGKPYVVVSTYGGRVVVIDGDNGTLLAQSEDFGVGGCALALADLDGIPGQEIVVAPLYSPTDQNANLVQCHLRVLKFTGNLSLLSNPVPLGLSTNANAPGVGACGIAIAELDASSPGKEILVGTLNGELLVFSQAQGVINPTPVFCTVLDGAVGAFNSIVVEDLHPLEGKPEVYVATSRGIVKFTLP